MSLNNDATDQASSCGDGAFQDAPTTAIVPVEPVVTEHAFTSSVASINTGSTIHAPPPPPLNTVSASHAPSDRVVVHENASFEARTYERLFDRAGLDNTAREALAMLRDQGDDGLDEFHKLIKKIQMRMTRADIRESMSKYVHKSCMVAADKLRESRLQLGRRAVPSHEQRDAPQERQDALQETQAHERRDVADRQQPWTQDEWTTWLSSWRERWVEPEPRRCPTQNIPLPCLSCNVTVMGCDGFRFCPFCGHDNYRGRQ